MSNISGSRIADARPFVLFKIPFGEASRRIKFMNIVRSNFHLLNSKQIAVLNYDCDGNDANDGDDDDVLKNSRWRFIGCYTNSWCHSNCISLKASMI